MRIELKILNKEFYYLDANCYDRDTRGCYGCEADERKNLPTYATPGSAGMDLRCTEDTVIYPEQVVSIPTGIAIWIGSEITDKSIGLKGKNWFEWCDVAAHILPRSGLGTKGLILGNTVGLLDSDYQGEIIIQAWNRNNASKKDKENCTANRPCGHIELKAGDKIAQLVFLPVIKVQWDIVKEFSHETKRGTGGFGHTG